MKNLVSVFAAAAIALVAASCNPSVNNPYKALEIPTKATEFVEKGHDFSLEFVDRINDFEKKDFIVMNIN